MDDATKERLGMQSKDDGEFWMSYKDFCRHFSEVTICLMGPDFDGDGISDNAGRIQSCIKPKDWSQSFPFMCFVFQQPHNSYVA